MNKVFPEIYSMPLGDAAPGSIAMIPSSFGLWLVLVTNQSTQKHLRSIVILNLNEPNTPSVVFHDNWEARDTCLCYATPLRFELSNKLGDIDTNSNWWRKIGVIASTKNEFLIRAAPAVHGGFRHVNIETGAVFSGEILNSCATFGVWSIWLRDPLRESSIPVFEFDINKSSSRQL